MFTIRMLAAVGLSAVLVTGSYASDNMGDTLTHEKSSSKTKLVENQVPAGASSLENQNRAKMKDSPKNFTGGSDDGQSIRRKQEQLQSGSGRSATLPDKMANRNMDHAKAKNFQGGSDDGSSIRRKQVERKGRSGSGIKPGRRGGK